jgi:hypothetical protein
MTFPVIPNAEWEHERPGPYERQMGDVIRRLLEVFADRVPDHESNAAIRLLASNMNQWRSAHQFFDEIRRRNRAGSTDQDRLAQYAFEETCAQAMYNATDPDDPFDPSACFFVVPAAITLARRVGTVADVAAAL